MSNTQDSILISLDQEMTERKTQDNNIHVKISNESVDRAENDAMCRIKIAEESAKRAEQHSKLSIRLSESEVKESAENSKLHLKILELENKVNKMSFGKMEPKREEPKREEPKREEPKREEPKKTLFEIAQDREAYVLLQALKNAELEELFKSPGNITVFAPTDEAFAKIPPSNFAEILSDKDKILQILNNHVASGKTFVKDAILCLNFSVSSKLILLT